MSNEDISPNAKIRRYMSFEKLMDLLENNRLYFCRADKFQDTLEGFYTKGIYEIAKGITIEARGRSSNEGLCEKTKRIRKGSYINCWTRSGAESVALWHMYGGKNSVSIESTIDVLEGETRDKSPIVVVPLFRHDVSVVTYIDHRSSDNDLAKRLLAESLGPIRHKNIAFEFEREVRAIYQSEFLYSTDVPREFPDGFNVPVNSKRLVQRLFVSPYADGWFYDVVTGILDRYGSFVHAEWSDLKFTPIQEVFSDSLKY